MRTPSECKCPPSAPMYCQCYIDAARAQAIEECKHVALCVASGGINENYEGAVAVMTGLNALAPPSPPEDAEPVG